MRFVLAVLSTILLQAGARAQDVRIANIEIAEKGIYSGEIKAMKEDRNLVAGGVHYVSATVLREATTTIPARLGVIFGFRYKVVGEPQGSSVPLRFVLKFPDGGVTNPTTGKTKTEQESSDDRTLGDIHLRGYVFDYAWEAVAGTWTFEIWSEQKKMAEQSFTIVKPK